MAAQSWALLTAVLTVALVLVIGVQALRRVLGRVVRVLRRSSASSERDGRLVPLES